MTLNAFLLIFVSVFLHAAWNLLSRASRPSISFFWLAETSGIIFLLPFLFIADIPWGKLPPFFWYSFIGSSIAESVYCIGLSKTYKKNDISIAYPLMRAIPVLLVAIITTAFHIGKPLNFWAFSGMTVVAAGCFILPQHSLKELNLKSFAESVCGPLLLSAFGTTIYTITDSIALNAMLEYSNSGSFVTSCVYFMMIKTGIGVCLAPLVLGMSSERNDLLQKTIKTINPYLVGIFTSGAYLLVLIAMGMVSNVSYLQAFRQLSLPLGVAMGIIFLHEKFTIPKIIGVCLIISGLILTLF